MNSKITNLIGLAYRSRNVSCGTDTVLTNIKSQKAKLVFVASDASCGTIKKIIDKCTFHKIEYCNSFDSVQLSNACGKDGIKVLSINDIGFCKNILNLIKESVDYEG